ncbi:phage tail tube protein [Ramlibacter sp.]|uniref:phage tail tube protein n=1 Tax=Ramlibacter sp. TaxID=1917967 RepID=UPI003D0EEAC1
MPKMMKKMAILAKIQASEGVDPVPTGASNAILLKDVELTPLDGELVQRGLIKPYFGHDGNVQTTAYGRLRFKVEVAGAGAAGSVPKYDPLLRACGHSATVSAGVSVTYAPISNSLEFLTIYGNVDGVLHQMVDAQGLVKATMDAKGFPMWEFDFMAPFLPVSDVVLPSTTYSFTKPVPFNKVNSVVTVHGTTVKASSFAWDAGNQLVKRDLTGVDSCAIVDRQAVGSVTFENVSVATKDWIGLAKVTTQGNMSVVHGVTAGNIVEFASTGRCEISKPTYSNLDGVQMLTLQNAYVPSTAGGDEYSWIIR